MIDKFVQIKNLGRFRDFNASGQTSLKKLTLFFAPNGAGKTTIAAALRSLASGDSTLMLSRRTLDSKCSPEVQLLVSGNMVSFNGVTWNNVFPNLIIFDHTFVEDNVYFGDCVGKENKESLYRTVIGSHAVGIAKRIDDLGDKIFKVNHESNQLRKAISAYILEGFIFDDFIALEQSTDIDQQIENLERELTSIKQKSEVIEKPLLSIVSLPDIPEDIIRTVETSIQQLDANVRDRLLAHFRTCSSVEDQVESWARQGLGYVKDLTCPFCGLNTDASELVQYYSIYFNAEYEGLHKRLGEIESAVSAKLGGSSLFAVKETILNREAQSTFWRNHIPSITPSPYIFSEIESDWITLRTELSAVLIKKLASPHKSLTVPDSLSTALEAFEARRQQMSVIADKTEVQNRQIQALKEQLKKRSYEDAIAELRLKKNKKVRHRSDVDALCIEYMNLFSKKRILEREKDNAKSELEKAETNILHEFQEEVNKYLGGFGAEFNVTGTKRSYIGGKQPRAEYKILIVGRPVDIETPKSDTLASFKTTLSAGDRSSLALAFFIAQLNPNGKIIVLDDPISSLDESRRRYTASVICKLYQDADQVIVFSHDPYFLHSIWKQRTIPEKTCLQISKNKNSSTIETCDISVITRQQYFKDWETVKGYLENPSSLDPLTVKSRIRPLVEFSLRVRNPDSFAAVGTLGEMLGIIKSANPESDLHDLKNKWYTDLDDLNGYATSSHHDEGSVVSSSIVEVTELRRYVDLACKFVSSH